MHSIVRFDNVSLDNIIYLRDHKDADHFVLPSLEVAPGEAGNVRDVDGGGFVDGRHC